MRTTTVPASQKPISTFDEIVLQVIRTKSGKKSYLTHEVMKKCKVPGLFRPLLYYWYYRRMQRAVKRLRSNGHEIIRVISYR